MAVVNHDVVHACGDVPNWDLSYVAFYCDCGGSVVCAVFAANLSATVVDDVGVVAG